MKKENMEEEFQKTRQFLRACMQGVVNGEINHQMAKDIGFLAQQQNYNMALEATLFPQEKRGIASKEILAVASNLVK